MDNTFSPARLSDFQRDVFPREQSRSLRDRGWEKRIAPIEPLWKSWVNAAGVILFMAAVIWGIR